MHAMSMTDTAPIRRPKELRAEEARTVLVCTAPHPKAGRGHARFDGRIHGVRLQQVPFAARPTYRVISGWSDADAGCVVVRCSSSDCRAFSEYQIIGPVRIVLAAIAPSPLEPADDTPDAVGTTTPPRGAEDRGRADPSPQPGTLRPGIPSHLPHPTKE